MTKPQIIWPSALLALFALACTDNLGGLDSGPQPQRDAGRTDARPVDAEPDAGPREAGSEDAAPADVGVPFGPCEDNTEGCPCTDANREPSRRLELVQGTCQDGLLCLPWDLFSGRSGDVTSSVAACLKPCAADSDCRSDPRYPDRVCTSSLPFSDTGTTSFCVDELALPDQYCGGSRNTESAVPGVPIRTGHRMLGCTAGECLFGAFGDIHPDEGVCAEVCFNDLECPSRTRPVCNLIFTAHPPYVGVCSASPLPGRGDFCGTNDPSKRGLLSRCSENDRGEILICAGGEQYDGIGFCIELCGTAHSCVGETSVPSSCEIIDPVDTEAGGVCLGSCENAPNNCDGSNGGQFGEGHFCFENWHEFDIAGGLPFIDCMSRRPQDPPFTFSFFDRYGRNIEVMGSNCADPSTPLGFAGCPKPGYCIELGPDQGACVVGCDLTRSDRGGCEEVDGLVAGTTTCTPALTTASGGVDQENGLCGVIPP